MKKILPALLCVILFAACKKESADFQPTTINDYAPLQIGKFITYSLDSLNYTNFGSVETHTFYEVKYEVTDTLTDLLGRKAFRITRYIRPVAGGSFAPDNTFVAVNTGTTFEFTENNLRFLKLVMPIQDGKTWKGNSAIDVSSLGSDLQYLYDWDYTYNNTDQPKTIGAYHLDSTVTVDQRDDSLNLPVVFPGPGVTDPTNIASRDYSQEIYSRNIGMVYKKFLHYEYQLAYHGYIGYGITLTMTDHN